MKKNKFVIAEVCIYMKIEIFLFNCNRPDFWKQLQIIFMLLEVCTF